MKNLDCNWLRVKEQARVDLDRRLQGLEQDIPTEP